MATGKKEEKGPILLTPIQLTETVLDFVLSATYPLIDLEVLWVTVSFALLRDALPTKALALESRSGFGLVWTAEDKTPKKKQEAHQLVGPGKPQHSTTQIRPKAIGDGIF